MNLLLLNWPKDQSDYLRTNLSPPNYQVYEASHQSELDHVLFQTQRMALIFFNTNNWADNKWNTFIQLKKRFPKAKVNIFDDNLNCWKAFKFTLYKASNYQLLPESSEELLNQVKNELTRLSKIHSKISSLSQRSIKVQTLDNLIMASMLEARGDEDTVNHFYRVQIYTKILVSNLAQMPQYKKIINRKYIHNIDRASILHDVGKLNIPFNILMKQHKLTDEEQEIIQDHCIFGKKVLDIVMDKIGAIPDFKMAALIALNHHERYDGSGYPNGLKGKSIPLEARIVALVDIYDALTSPRPYRTPTVYTHDQACKIIRERYENKIDPDILQAFYKNQEKFDDISFQYADIKTHETRTDLEKRRVKTTLSGQMPGDFIDLIALYPAIAEQAKSGMVIKQDGVCKFANKAMTEIIGYTIEEIEGMPFLDMVAPEYKNLFTQSLIVDKKDSSVYEVKIQTKNKVIKDVEIFVRSIHYKGRPAEMIIIRDITNLKRAEFEIRKLNSAVQQSIDGIAIADLEPKILYVNNAYARMHGYSPEEIIGMKTVDLHDSNNKEEMAKYKKSIHQIKTKGFWSGEIEHIRKDDTPFPTYMSVTLLKDECGKPTGILDVCRDITERRQAEDEKKKAYAELRKTQDDLVQSEKLVALGTFSSGIAHEIKNPLSIILGGIEFLEQKLTDADTDIIIAMKKVKESVLRADGIIHNLLKFARPAELQTRRVKTADLINDTLSLLKYRVFLINIEIKTKFASEDIYIEVDENQMGQVLFNILMNAIEAMPKGGEIMIKTYKTVLPVCAASRQPACVIEIKDTGKGISKDDFPKLFKPFFTTKEKGKGTGLGLPMTKMIVDNHKGRLIINSKPDQGTTVEIILPLARSEISSPLSPEVTR